MTKYTNVNFVNGVSKMTNYVVYYRVSTDKQGRSGLGLDVQRTKIHEFLKEDDVVLGEFVEIGSGKSNKREQLDLCLKMCRKTNSTLLVHRLDRFSRRVSFISGLMDQGIKLCIVELPNVTEFQLNIYSSMSQEEGRLISERTKQSLVESKKRGVQLGKYGKILSKINISNSIKFGETLRDVISPLLDDGWNYSRISNYLNENGYKSFRKGRFYPSTVRDLVLRLQS